MEPDYDRIEALIDALQRNRLYGLAAWAILLGSLLAMILSKPATPPATAQELTAYLALALVCFVALGFIVLLTRENRRLEDEVRELDEQSGLR